MNRALALFLLVCCSTLPFLSAQHVFYDHEYNPKTGTSLKMTAMSSTLPSSGYMAVRVTARNGEKIPVSWSFGFTSSDHDYAESNQLSSSFSLSCPPDQQKNVEFLVPLVTAIQDDSPLSLEVSISGRPPLTSTFEKMTSDQSHNWPCILMSEALYTPNSGPLNSAAASGSHYGSPAFAGSFTPRDLTNDWRGYAGFDAIMLTSADWKAIEPGAKTALMKWNRLGGRIVIYAVDPSVTLLSLGIEDAEGDEAYRSWGSIELLELPASGLLNASRTMAMMKTGELDPRASIFGKELVSSWPLQYSFGERSFNPVFFILILIAFGIIVGPVNLFVFAKSGQRHRLFITTPIISLTASALLLLIIVFQDGFGGKGHRLALVEVQPEENTAYIHQQQIARTGVLLNTSFTTKNNAIVTPVALDASRWARITPRNGGGESRYRISNGEKNTLDLSGDWYKSRSEYGHIVTSIQSTRGRLELLSPNGRPSLTSTFDFPIEKIYYVSSSGDLWQSSGEVKSGRKSELVPCTTAEFNDWRSQITKTLNVDSKRRFELLADRQGHFIALAKDGPFTDTLGSLSWKESTAIITGPIVGL
ncbi:hypothetical protein [Roseibacillus persicicus]|uniref:Uncharacterized protein n=1 Tax=Roseibacillus persicicus TaxID=454148 RepID=A0A918THD3_9BACT|nr:hypothetical protein [Roseibacillus persicicus]GHC49290.1 hypothetical protein GCM10007100_14020 [Roseibacillus persicicus]